MKNNVFLIDDDKNILASVSILLETEGYKVSTFSDGESGLKAILESSPDIAVVDIKMPRLDGIELLKKLRKTSDMPVIFLTSKDTEIDELLGLKVGADDYITKPFSQLELLARINALLRRSNPTSLDEELNYKNTISMNLKTHRVKREGSAVKLNPKEFDLLRLFMENPGKVFSRDQLLDKIWGNVNVEPRTVDVHIRRLRKNINVHNTKDLIRTVRSSGYSLDIIK